MGAEFPIEAVADWSFATWVEADAVAGIAMLKGSEIHFAAAPTWRGRLISRRRTRKFLSPLMQRFEFLTTRSLVDDRKNAAFLCRIGFVRTWSEGQIQHWMMTALPFEKGG